MKRFYKNWPMHNIVAHPLMQILEWIGMPELPHECMTKLCPLTLEQAAPQQEAPDRTGNWIEFDEAHALFDSVSVEAALAAQGASDA